MCGESSFQEQVGGSEAVLQTGGPGGMSDESVINAENWPPSPLEHDSHGFQSFLAHGVPSPSMDQQYGMSRGLRSWQEDIAHMPFPRPIRNITRDHGVVLRGLVIPS
jgi:hypothetical protein